MIRETIANSLIGAGRSLGKMSGLELKVELSEHSIEIEMAQVDNDSRAWDTDMFKSGNVFVENYANPIKPRVSQHQDLDTPDVAQLQEGTPEPETDQPQLESPDDDQRHAFLITSGRYREYMRQDLISQLLTPESRWNTLVMAVIGLGVLQFLAIIVTMWATGAF